MENFKSIDEVLDFAIESEQKAFNFYTKLANQSRNNEMREVFEEFAREEMGHKARLTEIKQTKVFSVSEQDVTDLKISDYVVQNEHSANITYQDALVLAMKREKAAYNLYTKLATKAPNDELKVLFQSLAQEEAKHKLRFELEYDEYVLREN